MIMAVIYYRFRSQKPDHIATIKFDGTGLTVFELKRDIIIANNLLHSTDVDIILYSTENIQDTKSWGDQNGGSSSSGERELDDDNEVVPRSTTVLVRRTMSPKKSKGNVQRYVAGKPRLQVSANSTSKTVNFGSGSGAMNFGDPSANGDEDDMIKKMFNAQDEQWSQQQDVMATATRVDNYRSNANEPVPDYYICYKCGEKGKHHIKNCPKNNDPNWEGVRVRKTTGIPKSHLKAIENPEDTIRDSNSSGNTTYMVNDEGKYVVAVADTKAWEKYQKIKKADSNGYLNGDIDVEDGELKDPETGKLWKSPVRIPCCNKVYSRKIIEDILIDRDFTCPNCGKEQIYLDTLVPDKELQAKVDEYVKNLSEDKNNGGNSPKRRQINPAGGPVNAGQLPKLPMMPMPPLNMPMPPLNMGMPPFMPFMPMPGMNPNVNANMQQNQNNQGNENRK